MNESKEEFLNDNQDLGQQSTDSTLNIEIIDIPQSIEIPMNKGKKKKGMLIVLFILIFLIIAVSSVLFTIFNLKKERKNAFLLSLNTIKADFNMMVEPMSKVMVDIGNKYSIEGNIAFNIKNEYSMTNDYAGIESLIEKINDMNINYATKIDVSLKKLLYQLIFSYNNKELLDIKYYNENKKHYINLGDVFGKYIQVEELDEEIISFFDYQQNIDDLDYIYNAIAQSLKNNLKDDYFIKKEATIDIDGKKKDVIKSSIILDKNQICELINNILGDLQKDTRAVDIISLYYPNFKDYKLEEFVDSEIKFAFSTYMNKLTGKHYLYQIEISNSDEKSLITYNLKKEKEIVCVYESEEFPLYNREYTFVISDKGDNIDIKMTDSQDEELLVMNIFQDKITATFKEDNGTYNNELVISFDYKKAKNGNDYEFDTHISLKISDDQKGQLSINVISDAVIKQDTNINEDISNAIELKDLTSTDQEEILNNLFEKLMKLSYQR